MILDQNADREPDYWVMDMAENGSFIRIAEYVTYDTSSKVSTGNHAIKMHMR